MSRYHRMTPARKAALRKAQLASAAKRKRAKRIRRIKRTVASLGLLGGLGAGAVLGQKTMRPKRSVVSQDPMSPKQLGQRVHRERGRPVSQYRVTWQKGRWIHDKGGVFRTGNKGRRKDQPRNIKRLRPAYDAQRRKEYGRGKR